MGPSGELNLSSTGNRRAFGAGGENTAARLLESKGYQILERNWRCRLGEIDLIALDPTGVTVFVEVKKARSHAFGTPESWVHRQKQAQIYRLAEAYLKFKKIFKIRSRFDVVAIDTKNGQDEVRHIQNAFMRM